MFAPMMAKKMMEKATKNFEDQFNNPYYRERPQTKEGEILIEKKPKENPKKDHSQTGEYVDYEEID